MRRGWAIVALLLLAGCKDEKKAETSTRAPLDDARMAALQAVAALPNMPKTVQFRGVQAYAQASPKRTAVCGLVSAFADDPNIFVPFVTIAIRATPPETVPGRFDFESRVGASTGEASRVYSALVANCWDKGGPAPERPLALPPLPDNIADPRTAGVADVAASAPVARAPPVPPSTGSVTVRQSANVHNGPGGPTIRTVQQGTTLRVYAQSSGWYQVGDTAPFGWVHESMLNR